MNISPHFLPRFVAKWILVTLIPLFLLLPAVPLVAQEKEVIEKESPTDLSTVSWEDDTSTRGRAKRELSGMDKTKQRDEIKRLEERERWTTIWGFFFFLLYTLGGVLTAYLTRDKKVAVLYPPELLILLHTFWPLEWLLLPLFELRKTTE